MAKWLRWMAAGLAFVEPASAADSFLDFRATYRCEVLRRLEQIYAVGDPSVALNRYLAISIPGAAQSYVQCIFYETRSRVLCEAASGFWATKKGQKRTSYLPSRSVRALANLGFDPDDSAGNFKRDQPVDAAADFRPLADVMLRALHDGYGARSDTKLQFNAPFAPAMPVSCIPVG